MSLLYWEVRYIRGQLYLLLPTDKIKFLCPYEAGIICDNYSYSIDTIVNMFHRTS